MRAKNRVNAGALSAVLALTAALGAYPAVQVRAEQPITAYKYGNVNMDTTIDIRDAVKALFPKSSLSSKELLLADVNKDGKVNTEDTTIMIHYILGTRKDGRIASAVTYQGAFIDAVEQFYGLMSEADKNTLKEVQSQMNGLVWSDWVDILDPLLTPQVQTKIENSSYGSLGAAREDLTKLAKDMLGLPFIGEADKLASAMATLRYDHMETITILFGSDFSMEEFYGFMWAYSDALKTAASNLSGERIREILSGDRDTATRVALECAREAMAKVIASGEHTAFTSKLSANGWNADSLVKVQFDLLDSLPSGRDAQEVLIKAILKIIL